MTELEELRARVDALERQAAGGRVSNLFPNVITRAADGSIGANLSGHLAAQGVDLPSSEVGINPTGNTEIRWLRKSDGAVVADVWAFDDPLSFETVLNIEAQSLGNTGGVSLVGRGAAPANHFGGLNVQSDGVTVATDQAFRTLLAGAGGSDWVQLQELGNQVIDDNFGHALYTAGFGAIAPGGSATASFTTDRPNWSTAAPIGAISGGALPWGYTFTAPNTWNIIVANPFAFNSLPVTWAGYVYGH